MNHEHKKIQPSTILEVFATLVFTSILLGFVNGFQSPITWTHLLGMSIGISIMQIVKLIWRSR